MWGLSQRGSHAEPYVSLCSLSPLHLFSSLLPSSSLFFSFHEQWRRRAAGLSRSMRRAAAAREVGVDVEGGEEDDDSHGEEHGDSGGEGAEMAGLSNAPTPPLNRRPVDNGGRRERRQRRTVAHGRGAAAAQDAGQRVGDDELLRSKKRYGGPVATQPTVVGEEAEGEVAGARTRSAAEEIYCNTGKPTLECSLAITHESHIEVVAILIVLLF
uniref:Uncharacterized protein n=1 Tax=Oryza glumipatula TaxID=40148 RepID=A0A0E0B099_9ORYZ